MKIINLLLIFLSFALISCSEGEDGKDGETAYITVEPEKDSTPDIIDTTSDIDDSEPNYILLSSIAEKGPCNKGAAVLAFPLFDNFIQTGAHFLGETKTDLGYWEVPAQISEELTETKLEGLCYSELNGSTGTQKLGSIFFTSSSDRNINSLTTIAVDVIRWVYGNQIIKDRYQAIIDAENLVSGVFGLGTMAPFASISLNDGNLDAAKLAVTSSAILAARSNQTDFMVEITQAIKAGNTTAIELELATAISNLKILEINNNLKSKYESLNQTWVYPPMHTVAGFPDYYEDLLSRVPSVISEFNIHSSSGCSLFKWQDANMFVFPHVFDSIEEAKYISTNMDGELSIWTRGPTSPGTKVVDVVRLKENVLVGLTNAPHNGYLGENHGLTNGTDYYLMFRKDENFTMYSACSGDETPFGSKLASDDEGASWTVNTAGVPYQDSSGLILFLTD